MTGLLNPSHGVTAPVPPIAALIARAGPERFWLAVEEESAYAYWIWFPPFARSELETRWQALGTAGSLTDWHAALGGDWVGAHSYGEDAEDPCSDCAQFLALYKQRTDTRRWYRPFICCDEHSSLWTPDGRVLVHAGYSGSVHDMQHPTHAEAYRRRTGV